jgi:hypothetical protein
LSVVVERAPLRPVPRRPDGPVEPDLARRHVEARLPRLEPLARDALALVTLSGRTRAEAAARLEVPEAELAAALGRGRKELRRAAEPLAGSGWCERAELLISDRFDGALDERGAARLDVHLRNCPRCVEHERRLVQAIDLLVEELVGEPEPLAAPPAPLRLAEARSQRRPAPSLGKGPIASRPFGAPVAPAERIEPPIEPPGQPGPIQPPQQPPEQPPVEPPQPGGPEPAPPEEPTIDPPAQPPGPVEDALPDRVAAAAVEPIRRSTRELVMAVSWRALLVLAVICAIAAIAITVWGATGGGL